MKIFEKDVDINKMKRLGVITVAQDRIDKYDYRAMQRDGKSLNQAFFDRMQQCTYSANNGDCILSTMDSGNLILAHFDNDAIFLLSEDAVLAPQEFVASLAKLMECSNEMKAILSRNSGYSFSNFGLNNLNINFARVELATEIPESTIEHYVLSGKPTQTSFGKIIGECANNIGLEYNCKKGTFTYAHTSDYGTSLLGFINEMIRTNPDMRLLMSNVVCYRKEPELAQAMADTIGKHSSIGYFERGDTLPKDVFQRALSSFGDLVKDENFLRTFEEEKRYRIRERHDNNSQYEVYDALRAAIQQGDDTVDIDSIFQLEWHDGNPDLGIQAIFSSLNRINKEMMMDRGCLAPRGIPEVKEYMGNVTAKAHQLSQDEREQLEKTSKIK